MKWCASLAAAVVSILLVGCTNDPVPPRTTAAAVEAPSTAATRSSSDLPTSQTPGSPATVATIPAGTGVSAHHVLAGCDQARTITDAFPMPTDVVIGTLSYAGLKATYPDPPREPNWDDGGYFYTTGAQLRPGVSVTVTIADEAADYAAIVTENGPARGSRSVTYQSCTTSSTRGSWWVGGFVIWNRNSACIPIDATNPGDPSVRRVMIALGAGSCH